MTLGRSRDVEEMKDNGKVLEYSAEGYDREVFRLSGAFLNNEPYDIPQIPIAEEGLHIINQALKAAAIIDRVFDTKKA